MNLFPRSPHWDVLTYEQKLRMLIVFSRKQYIYARRKWHWKDAYHWKIQRRTFLDSLKCYKDSVDKCNHSWYIPWKPIARCKNCLAERPEN